MSFALPALAIAAAARAQSPVPYPHPLISEVLYAVPSGARGDANGDGTRDAVGDEFIELVNPHDKPIQMKGYVIMDSDAYAPGAPTTDAATPAKPAGNTPTSPAKPGGPSKPAHDSERSQVRFVFPEFELKPGQVAVVFNGYHQKIPGPVGEPGKSAPAPNDHFHGAFVFTMNNDSPYAALANDADFVLLQAPDGKPIQVIRWGKTEKTAPKDTLLVEEAPQSIGSVQRDGVHGKLVPHRDLKGDLAGTLFSPGVFSLTPTADSTPSKPAKPAGSGTNGRP